MKDVMGLCWAASQGDLEEIQRMVASGVDLNESDYDGRTCIHLAASEGHVHVVKYLMGKKVNLVPKDRWGGTPLDDATRYNSQEICELLVKKIKIN
ncbi:ankyrin repeat domain-containing protein [bacterium]|jgi:glutaminase|nr:ankyrin repeat domain-containing protein [bacterium]